MIPQLESPARAAGTINVPPPRFKGITGPVRNVDIRLVDYLRQHGRTGAQECGRRYESQVQECLQTQFPFYIPEPFVHFTDNSYSRTVRPDGVLVYPKHVVIFEIKYTHVPEAWWQLEKLYKVVLDGLYHRPISLVEICRSYDPATPFPCPVGMISDLETWVSEHRSTFGVHVWRKPNL